MTTTQTPQKKPARSLLDDPAVTRWLAQQESHLNSVNPVFEKWVDTENGFSIHRSQETGGVVDAVKEAAEQRSRGDGARYLGSVPEIVCEVWAKECGAAIGTPEFRAYAKKMLMTGEFQKLRVR